MSDTRKETVSRRRVVRFEACFVCSECRAPLVVCEQKRYIDASDRRFLVLCPVCKPSNGFRIIASHVNEAVKVTLPKGGCVFHPKPHNCDGHCYDQKKRRKGRKNK